MSPRRHPSRRPTSPPPRPPATPTSASGERLQKLLAAAGLGSRREIERWIAAGRVSVNGRVARIGERAGADSVVALDGAPVQLLTPRAAPRVLLYHKPVGEIVSRRDPGGRPTVFARLPALRGARWIAVGRLDLNSSGLLLFTDSGELAAGLMHPRYGYEREYAVRVRGELPASDLRRLLHGVELEDGSARLAQVEPMQRSQDGGANRWYRAVLREGRNREMRRIFEAIGHPVSRLLRVRFGPLRLPRALRPGRWIELGAAQVQSLAEAAQPARSRRDRGAGAC